MLNDLNKAELDYSDVLIVPKSSEINSRKDVDITRVYTFKWGAKPIEGCGVIAANMFTTGTFAIAREFQKHKMFTALHKHYSSEQIIEFLENNRKTFGNNDYIFISTGLRSDDFKKLSEVMITGLCNNICLDAPNAYIPAFKATLNKLRLFFPKAVIMAGNAVTSDKVGELIREGADFAKTGLGSGASCSTRVQTGVGRPQFSAIQDCIYAARQNGGMICADGGITNPGDICKAFGANSDFVMIGNLIAGSNEAGGEKVTKRYLSNELDSNDEPIIEEKVFKINYGMASDRAQKLHYGGVQEYRANEGIVSLVPYTGPVQNTLRNIEGGLRSCMTYVGAKNLAELPQHVTFCRVNHQINRLKGSREIE